MDAMGKPYFHIVAESLADGAARVRWNEYGADEREEAIRAFKEVEVAIEHFPGAERCASESPR